jgi:hypothetical protein
MTNHNMILLGEGHQRSKVIKMKLTVGIGKRDAVIPGSFESAAEGRAISSILIVPQQADSWVGSLCYGCDFCGGVAAAVVNDNDLVFPGYFGKRSISLFDGLADNFFFIKGGDDKGYGPAGAGRLVL